MQKYIMLICLLLFAQLIFAQTIEELTDIAIRENAQLKMLEKEYLAALEKAPQVGNLPDPEVGVGIFPLPVETRLGPQILRVGATQTFYWKGLRDGRKDLELAKARTLNEKVAASVLDLRYRIEQAYFQLYEIEKSRFILGRNIALLNSLEKLALAKVESGKGSAADVLRIQLQSKTLLREIELLEKEKAKPQITINRILQRNLETTVDLPDTLGFANVLFLKDSILSQIALNHPWFRMFELQKEVAKQEMNLNRINGKPTFGVGLDYIMVTPRDDVDLPKNGRDIVQLRGTVKIPLYRKKYDAKLREEQLKIEAIDFRKEDLLNEFAENIEQAYVDYETAQIRMELYQEQIEITQTTRNILEANYSATGSGFDELLKIEQELIDLDLKKLQAIVQSHLAKSAIKRYLVNK